MTKLIADWKALILAVLTAGYFYHQGLDMSPETFFEIAREMALGFLGLCAFYSRMILRGMREIGWL